MNKLMDDADKRERELKELRKFINAQIKKMPEGTLRICSGNNRTQYYYRASPSAGNGVYIPGKNKALAEKLAQKDYYGRLLASLEQEMRAIEMFKMAMPAKMVEFVHEDMSEKRRALINPLFESDEEYVANWLKQEYVRKDIPAGYPVFFTEKGERVRSKSEVIIAGALERAGVPYRYEAPVYLEGMGRVHPDFTALNVRLRKEFFWEHQGMMDDPGYANDAVRKVSAYTYNGYFPGDNLIITSETAETPLNTQDINAIIRHFLI